MDWKDVLRRRLSSPNTDPKRKKSEQELKDEEMDLFTKYYSEWKGGRKNTNEFYKTIPRFYYRAIQELMKIHGQDPVSFQDVKDEIFDMVKPKDPLKISLQDLINSNQGDTVTTILIDLNGFWTYENREALVTNDNENSADLDDT